MRYVGEDKPAISRHGFLKLSFAGISGMGLLLLSGCVAGGGNNDEDDDGDDNQGEDD
jgi:hypothetical protein